MNPKAEPRIYIRGLFNPNNTMTTDTNHPTIACTVLDLTVRNHPGVLSHVCSLFARRAFNLDGVICLPVGNAANSRIWLRVTDDHRLDQLVKQLRKLEDVLSVVRDNAGIARFAAV